MGIIIASNKMKNEWNKYTPMLTESSKESADENIQEQKFYWDLVVETRMKILYLGNVLFLQNENEYLRKKHFQQKLSSYICRKPRYLLQNHIQNTRQLLCLNHNESRWNWMEFLFILHRIERLLSSIVIVVIIL